MHEASTHDSNCFITLTYDDDHLPKGGTLVKSDFQKFCKRLRKATVAARGRGFRFFACGEYGDENGRPHYHALLFGLDFFDKTRWRTTPAGSVSYRSKSLERYWTAGSCEIGECNFESAAYVARYCCKLMNGEDRASYYDGRLPEFGLQSRRPGIGAGWFEDFAGDVYPDDYVIARGVKSKPPRYYDKLLERRSPLVYGYVKSVREPENWSDFYERKAETTPARLAVKAEIVSARFTRFKRGM